MKVQQLWPVLKKAVKDFSDDECMTSGAAIAYYTIFSLPPLLVLVFFIAEQFGVSQDKIDTVVRDQLGMPITQAQTEQAAQGPSTGGGMMSRLGILGRVIGIGILIFSATSVFAQLQYALNRAWEVQQDPQKGGVLPLVMKRLLSLGMIAVIAFLLLVSMVLTTMTDEIVRMVLGGWAGQGAVIVGGLINSLITLGVATLLFAAMFKFLPDARMRWRDTWVGAAMTALLFVIGKTLIGVYLNNSEIGSEWGAAAASMVALLVWVYYSVLIVLFGAELTQAWTVAYGAGIQPTKNAVRIVEEKRVIPSGHPAPG